MSVFEPLRWTICTPGRPRTQDVAVVLFERRATEYRALLSTKPLADGRREDLQPRPAILIGKRRTAGHFVHVGFWVEIVRIVISPSELLGELFAHRRLTAARYAH